MEYLTYSLGTTGDSLPLIKLTARLKEKGFKAAFVGNEKFTHLCELFGIHFISVSTRDSYEKTYNNSLTWSPNHAQNHYRDFHFPAIEPTFRLIRKLVHQGHQPVIIYQDELSGARMAAEAFNLKSCQIVLAPQTVGSTKSPPYPLCRQVEESLWDDLIPKIEEKSKRDVFNRLIRPFINPLKKELGLKEWTKEGLPTLKTAPAVLALFPEWLKPKPSDWPNQLVNTGFILDNSESVGNAKITDDFIEKYGAPLVFTFGSGIPVASHLITKIKKVCHLLNRPGIFVAHSQKEKVLSDRLSPVLVVPAAPFGRLFSRSVLVVHHGGVGTCAQALAAGVPQIISPYTFDQPDNAYLLWSLGVGNAVDFLHDSPDSIAKSIKTLLNSKNIDENVKKYAEITVDETDSTVSYLLSLTQ